MGCGTNIVPGYKEFDKEARKNASNPGLEAKTNQLITQSWRMNEEKMPLFDARVQRKLYPKKRRKSVDRMTRKELISNLEAMELPETNARDFDNNEIRDILIDQAPELFMSTL
jgi:hypothetical protein